MIHTYVIPGKPFAKQRPRHSTAGGFAKSYTPKETKSWEAQAKAVLSQQAKHLPLEGPVAMTIYCLWECPNPLKRSTRPRRWGTSAKDWDNLGKIVSDAGNGILYNDDRQVVCATVYKLIADQGEPPRVVIHLDDSPVVPGMPLRMSPVLANPDGG